jgi:hypothetical protein
MPPPTLNAPGTWAAWANNAATLQSYVAAPDPPGTLMFQVQKPPGGATGDKVNIPACNGPKYVRLGYTITGEWAIDPLDVSNVVPIVGTQAATGKITPPTGASGGLWTHTPTDWTGNQISPPQQTPPPGWPTDAVSAVPPAGAKPPGAPPVISGVSSSAITATGATINWTVQPSSASQVEYGTTTAYGTTRPAAPINGAGAQSTPLTGLVTATLYHYRIVATANGVTVRSGDFTFTTA